MESRVRVGAESWTLVIVYFVNKKRAEEAIANV
jgi:hypothetical protein